MSRWRGEPYQNLGGCRKRPIADDVRDSLVSSGVLNPFLLFHSPHQQPHHQYGLCNETENLNRDIQKMTMQWTKKYKPANARRCIQQTSYARKEARTKNQNTDQ